MQTNSLTKVPLSSLSRRLQNFILKARQLHPDFNILTQITKIDFNEFNALTIFRETKDFYVDINGAHYSKVNGKLQEEYSLIYMDLDAIVEVI